MCRVSARRLSNYLQFTPKKYIQYFKSEKEKQKCMGSIRQSLQNHKKIIDTPNQPIETKKKSQIKVCLVLQK
jgi:hypothetical protein